MNNDFLLDVDGYPGADVWPVDELPRREPGTTYPPTGRDGEDTSPGPTSGPSGPSLAAGTGVYGRGRPSRLTAVFRRRR